MSFLLFKRTHANSCALDTMFVMIRHPRRMGIESPHLVPVKWCRHKQGQSPAVLVKQRQMAIAIRVVSDWGFSVANNLHAWGLRRSQSCCLILRVSQSSVVLGVKPAVEDVDVRLFLAFQRTLVKDQIEPNKFLLTRLETCC